MTVNGDLHIDRTSGVRLENVDVAGNVDIDHASDAADPLSAGTNLICSSTVGHDLVIHDSAHGAPWSIGACGPNTIGHDLRFDHNERQQRHLGQLDRAQPDVRQELRADRHGNTAGGKKEKQCAGL